MTQPTDDRGAIDPCPIPFAGDDDPTPLESNYRMDPRNLQAVGLVPKGIDVDPPASRTWHARLAVLDQIERYLDVTPKGQSAELDHVRNLVEAGS